MVPNNCVPCTDKAGRIGVNAPKLPKLLAPQGLVDVATKLINDLYLESEAKHQFGYITSHTGMGQKGPRVIIPCMMPK